MDDKRFSSASRFQASAEELSDKLAPYTTAEALTMAREARSLASTFRSWDVQPPKDETRISTIQQLFELNRKVMDFISRQPRAPSSKSVPPGRGSVPPPSQREGPASSRQSAPPSSRHSAPSSSRHLYGSFSRPPASTPPASQDAPPSSRQIVGPTSRPTGPSSPRRR